MEVYEIYRSTWKELCNTHGWGLGMACVDNGYVPVCGGAWFGMSVCSADVKPWAYPYATEAEAVEVAEKHEQMHLEKMRRLGWCRRAHDVEVWHIVPDPTPEAVREDSQICSELASESSAKPGTLPAARVHIRLYGECNERYVSRLREYFLKFKAQGVKLESFYYDFVRQDRCWTFFVYPHADLYKLAELIHDCQSKGIKVDMVPEAFREVLL